MVFHPSAMLIARYDCSVIGFKMGHVLTRSEPLPLHRVRVQNWCVANYNYTSTAYRKT